jgi:hypothetical protein
MGWMNVFCCGLSLLLLSFQFGISVHFTAHVEVVELACGILAAASQLEQLWELIRPEKQEAQILCQTHMKGQ